MSPVMWKHHLVNLLARSWTNLLIALSSSTLSVAIFSLAIPTMVFLSVFLYRRQQARTAGHHMEDVLRDTAIPTLIAGGITMFGWLCLFGWSISATIYKDHQNLVSSNQSLKANASNQVDPKSRDEEIASLKRQIERFKEQQGPPTIKIFPFARVKHFPVQQSATMDYIFITNTIRTPVDLLVTCDFPLEGIYEAFLTQGGGSVMTIQNTRVSANQFRGSIMSPAWSPSLPLYITLFFPSGKVDRMPSCSFKPE